MNKLFEEKIKSWKGLNNKPTCYFYVYYFRNLRSNETIKKLKIENEHKDYYFKTSLSDGSTSEKIVNHIYNRKLEIKRLNKKLQDLNIKIYEITTTECGKLNNTLNNFFKYKNI